MSERLTYRTNEMASMLGVSESTVLRWAAARKIESFRIGGTRLFPKAGLLRFLQNEDEHDTLVSIERRPA